MAAVAQQHPECVVALMSSGTPLELESFDKKGNSIWDLASRDDTGYFMGVRRLVRSRVRGRSPRAHNGEHRLSITS